MLLLPSKQDNLAAFYFISKGVLFTLWLLNDQHFTREFLSQIVVPAVVSNSLVSGLEEQRRQERLSKNLERYLLTSVVKLLPIIVLNFVFGIWPLLRASAAYIIPVQQFVFTLWANSFLRLIPPAESEHDGQINGTQHDEFEANFRRYQSAAADFRIPTLELAEREELKAPPELGSQERKTDTGSITGSSSVPTTATQASHSGSASDPPPSTSQGAPEAVVQT